MDRIWMKVRKLKRFLAAVLAVALLTGSVQVSALAELDGWTEIGHGIAYRVDQKVTGATEEITVTAESDLTEAELAGIELPDGEFVAAEDGSYAEATYIAEDNGSYGFRIVYQLFEDEHAATPANAEESPSDATASPSDAEEQEDAASPSDAERATGSDAAYEDDDGDGIYYDEDGELIIEDAEIMADGFYLVSAMSLLDDEEETSAAEAGNAEGAGSVQTGSYDLQVMVADLSGAEAAITLQWQNSDGDVLEDVNECSRFYKNAYLSLNFSLTGDEIYPAESVKITIPNGKYLLPTRDGDWFSGSLLYIPTAKGYKAVSDTKQTLNGTVMDCYTDGDDIIIMNNAAIDAGNYSFGAVFRYGSGSLSTEYKAGVEIADMTETTFTASVELNDEAAATSNEVSFVYNTKASMSVYGSTNVNAYGNGDGTDVWHCWNEQWGDMPAEYPEDQYFYAVHRFSVRGWNNYSNHWLYQPLSIKMIQETVPSDGTLLGYQVGELDYDSELSDISSQFYASGDLTGDQLPVTISDTTTGNEQLYYINYIVAYPKPADGETPQYTMTIDVTGIGVDELDDELTGSASSIVKYAAPVTFSYHSDGYGDFQKIVSVSSSDSGLAKLKSGNDLLVTFDYGIDDSSFYIHYASEAHNGVIATITDLLSESLLLDGEKLNSDDYTLYYISSGKGMGTYTITEDGRGNQSSTYTKTYYPEKVEYLIDETWENESKWTENKHNLSPNLTDFDGIRLSNSSTTTFDVFSPDVQIQIKIHPTDHVISLIDDKDHAVLSNTAALSLVGADGTDLYEATSTDSVDLYGNYGKAPYIEFNSKYYSTQNEQYASRTVAIFFKTAYYNSFAYDSLDSMRAYIALPKYMKFDGISKILAECNGTSYDVDESDYQIEKIGTQDNYTIYAVEIDESDLDRECGNQYYVYLNVKYPIEAIKNYESNPVIKVAWQTLDGSNLTSGTNPKSSYASVKDTTTYEQTTDDDLSSVLSKSTSGDKPGAYKDFSVFEDIDGNGEVNQIAVNGVTVSFSVATAYESNYAKTVMGSVDDAYGETGSTEVGSLYRYHLRLSNSSTSQRQNIVMYDYLEQAYGNNAHWNGTFEYVDTADCEEIYDITPTVYYSTQTGLSSDTVPTAEELQSDDWTTTCPDNPADVTAVAIDFGDFLLDVKQAVYVDIVMRAPSRMLTDDGGVLYAYNDTSYRSDGKDQSDGDDAWQQVLLQAANQATVALVEPEVNITKTSDPESGTSTAPAAVLTGSELIYTLTLSNASGYLVRNVIAEDEFDDTLTFKTLTVSKNSADPVTAEDAGVTCSWDGNRVNITIPEFANNCTYALYFTMQVAEDAADGTVIENTAAITSIGGDECRIESDTTYHEIVDKSFKAGRGMELLFTVNNAGSKSVDIYPEIVLEGIPEGAVLELYDVTDCEQADEGWYVPKTGAECLGTFETAGTDSVTLSPEVYSGSVETESAGEKGRDYHLVLYLKQGDMSDLNFTVSAQIYAIQHRNNPTGNKSQSLGFSDKKTLVLFDGSNV